jgi:hypothetical protein
MKRMAPLAGFALALIFASVAQAQSRGAPTAPPACSSTGYAKPLYGTFGNNDGFAVAYEIASACIPKAVRDAAEANGMGRYSPLGVKNVSTIRFKAVGSIADETGNVRKLKTLDAGMSFVAPGVRLALDFDDRTPDQIRVFAAGETWNEKSPGVGRTAAPGTAESRSALLKLTPLGAFWSIVEAEGNVRISTRDGRTVFSGTSPYDGIPVTIVLNDKMLPESAEALVNGKRYAAQFAEYSEEWESAYLVPFPRKLVWTVDGKPLANLTVTAFNSNPYVVFPVPK